MSDDECDQIKAERIAGTKFVVEATSCEVQMLWERHSIDAMFARPETNRYKFEQLNPGFIETIGHLDNRQVNVEMFWHRINGVLVMYVNSVSQVVDHKMIEEWLKKKCSPRWCGGSRLAHTDASNFHHVLDYVRNPDQR